MTNSNLRVLSNDEINSVSGGVIHGHGDGKGNGHGKGDGDGSGWIHTVAELGGLLLGVISIFAAKAPHEPQTHLTTSQSARIL